MKIAVIADIHASEAWKDIVEMEKDRVDRFVFLGDYVDSKHGDVSAVHQVDNLLELIGFKAESGRVDLLIGNHDLQYMGGARTNQYNRSIDDALDGLFVLGVRDYTFQLCAIYGDYIFSHAGISRVWMANNGLRDVNEINKAFHATPLIADFVRTPFCDRSGDDIFQSPLWIRPDSLREGAVSGYNQVVGHTQVYEITTIESVETQLTFADARMLQYLVIDTNFNEIERKPAPVWN